jgi:Mycothiol maleylpyruvate isomerase N-terminal domain
MYLNALEFLEEEREAWRPFEALDGLSDERLDAAIEGAHGWTGRDLVSHLVAGQEWATDVAKELAVGPESPTKVRLDAAWAARGDDPINEEVQMEWRALPIDEVRRRLRTVPGELRGYLTVVPETRWLKHPAHLKSFHDDMTAHYEDHRADLAAILDAAR